MKVWFTSPVISLTLLNLAKILFRDVPNCASPSWVTSFIVETRAVVCSIVSPAASAPEAVLVKASPRPSTLDAVILEALRITSAIFSCSSLRALVPLVITCRDCSREIAPAALSFIIVSALAVDSSRDKPCLTSFVFNLATSVTSWLISTAVSA